MASLQRFTEDKGYVIDEEFLMQVKHFNMGLVLRIAKFLDRTIDQIKDDEYELQFLGCVIDDNPDTKTSIWHSDPDPQSGQMMTKVHVVFFDSLNGTVTRSWVNVNDTQPFIGTETLKKAADVDSIAASDELELFYDNFKSALNSAKKASKLSLQSRRSMYCALYKTKDSYKFR